MKLKISLLLVLSSVLFVGCNSIATPSENTSSDSITSQVSNNTASSSSEVPTSSSSVNKTSIDNTYYTGNYYNSINTSMTGGINGTLRKALTELIDNPKLYTYKGSSNNALGYLLSQTDVDENGKMVLFYSQDKITPEKSSRWNREHVWPQSLSGGLYGTTGGGCDMHHIRPTAEITNSNRGNLKYGEVDHATAKVSKNTTYGTNTVSGYYSNSYFEPLDSVKGDAARICLYMYTCYFASGKLKIENVAQSVQLLVKWSNEDLPSKQEIIRNEKVFKYQGNRNPYIDHPEFVNIVFGNGTF